MFTPAIKARRSEQGFSMIELIVALALGAVLAAGISSVYLENKKNYVMDEEMARLQENGRFAMDILKREIKMAGFYGGVQGLPATIPFITGGCMSSDNWTLNLAEPIEFINDAKHAQTLPQTSTNKSLASCVPVADLFSDIGNDVLVIKRLADRPTMTSKIVDPSVVNESNVISPRAGWYLVSNGTSKTFQKSNTGLFVGATVTGTGDNSGTEVWQYQSKIYWVRDCSVCTPDKDNIPTLMVTYLDNDAYKTEAVVEGVEVFHLEFGLAATVDDLAPTRFTANPSSAELELIRVVRVFLLMRTRDPVRGYTDTNVYTLGSKTAIDKGADPDSFKRKLFTTTVSTRNVGL